MPGYQGIYDPQDPWGFTSGAVNGVNDPYNFSSGANYGVNDPYGHYSGVVDGALNGVNDPANRGSLYINGQWRSADWGPTPISQYYDAPMMDRINGTTGRADRNSDFLVIGQDTSGRNADIWSRDPRASSHDGKKYAGSGGAGDTPGAGGPNRPPGGQPPGGQPSYPNGVFNPGTINGQPPPNLNPPGFNFPGGPGGNGPGGTYFQGGLPGSKVDQSTMSAEDSLNNYFNTPGYQLLNGQSAVDRFQASPGYDYAVKEAMGGIQKNAAAKGLLESGAVMREMGDRAGQMANQEYNNWHNQQAQQYGDYQNRLQGLAGGPTGSQYAFNAGQLMGQNAMQTGNNMGSLFGNMANGGFGAIMNTGAAYANNLLNARYNQVPQMGNNQQPQFTGLL